MDLIRSNTSVNS